MNMTKYENSFKKESKQYKVFSVLKDKEWHCRKCDYEHVETTQIAGSGGIKGLRNGTKERDGLIIKSEYRYCNKCQSKTRQDRWTGGFREAIPVGSFPERFSKLVFKTLKYKDIVEMTERSPSQLTIDHKLPRIRWNAEAEQFQNDYENMTEQDIRNNFQLLKKSNGAVSHNLLKSRACEKCFREGIRGTPFNIQYYYEGDASWRPENKKDPAGCVGCGWYDFDQWRDSLNNYIKNQNSE